MSRARVQIRRERTPEKWPPPLLTKCYRMNKTSSPRASTTTSIVSVVRHEQIRSFRYIFLIFWLTDWLTVPPSVIRPRVCLTASSSICCLPDGLLSVFFRAVTISKESYKLSLKSIQAKSERKREKLSQTRDGERDPQPVLGRPPKQGGASVGRAARWCIIVGGYFFLQTFFIQNPQS